MKKQIVITLNDDDYNRIMDYGLILEADRNILASAIKHGTPLPEHHGRLIDADSLLESFRDGTEAYDCRGWTKFEIAEEIDNEPTVLEGSDKR